MINDVIFLVSSYLDDICSSHFISLYDPNLLNKYNCKKYHNIKKIHKYVFNVTKCYIFIENSCINNIKINDSLLDKITHVQLKFNNNYVHCDDGFILGYYDINYPENYLVHRRDVTGASNFQKMYDTIYTNEIRKFLQLPIKNLKCLSFIGDSFTIDRVKNLVTRDIELKYDNKISVNYLSV